MKHLETLAKLELSTETDRFIVSFGGRYFQVGEMLYEMIALAQQDLAWSELEERIKNKFPAESQQIDLKAVFEEKVGKIIDAAAQTKKSYVYFKINILSEARIATLTKPLLGLFRKGTVWTLATFSLCCSFFYFCYQFDFRIVRESTTLRLVELGAAVGFLYAISVLIMLFHELGHATASRRFGVRSSSIGFGFYLIFPVFYTDVSKIWTLPMKKRIVVNLGGIYFQLLVNLFLIIAAQFTANMPMLKTGIDLLLLSNSFMILSSLNPFLRNDGYWVFCDYFKIYNLMEKVMVGPTTFFRTYYRNLPWNTATLPITIYGTINYFIFMMIGVLVIRNLHHSLLGMVDMFSSGSFFAHFTIEKLIQLAKLLFSLTICSIYITKACRLAFQKVLLSIKPVIL